MWDHWGQSALRSGPPGTCDVLSLNAADVCDFVFHPLIYGYGGRTLILTDSGFRFKVTGEPRDSENLEVCKRHACNERMLTDTVRSVLTDTCQLKRVE